MQARVSLTSAAFTFAQRRPGRHGRMETCHACSGPASALRRFSTVTAIPPRISAPPTIVPAPGTSPIAAPARTGTTVDLAELAQRLSGLAYARVDLVTKRGEFAVRGASHFPSEQLERIFTAQRRSVLGLPFGGADTRETGEIFDQTALEAAATEIHQMYRNEGYLFSQVVPQVERTEGEDGASPTVDVTLAIARELGWDESERMLGLDNPAPPTQPRPGTGAPMAESGL